MCRITFSNRRVAYRNKLDIKGKLSIFKNDSSTEKTVEVIITDLTVEGMQIVFSDNSFLYDFISYDSNDEDVSIKIFFSYYNYNEVFNMFVRWLKINDIGESSYYTLAGLGFRDMEHYRFLLTDIINDIYMSRISSI